MAQCSGQWKFRHFFFTLKQLMASSKTRIGGPGSSVGIATELRAGRSGVESQ